MFYEDWNTNKLAEMRIIGLMGVKDIPVMFYLVNELKIACAYHLLTLV